MHAERTGLHPVEGEREKRPVEHHGGNDDDRRADQLAIDVVARHSEDITEEQRRHLSGERTCLRHNHDAERQHADEEQPDTRVFTNA